MFWANEVYENVYLGFKRLACLACLASQMETIVKKITQPNLPKMKNELAKICNEPGISVNKR